MTGWLAAPDNSVTFVSHRGHKFEGLTTEEARGDSWKAALHLDDVVRASIAWAEDYERGTTYEIEAGYRRKKEGGYRWQLVRAEPMQNEAGVITSWFKQLDRHRRPTPAQEHLKLPLAELQHRGRNSLAVVRSIARRRRASRSTASSRISRAVSTPWPSLRP